MGIEIKDGVTEITCNTCAVVITTDKPNGVVPNDWMTGHLWLDISLSEQKQVPLCFCPECKPRVLTDLQLSLAT